jgi:carbohydrate kinase (thermoresistant glucokinase family)
MPQRTKEKAVVLVLMGPMGCGKTTIGKLLSDRLSRPFHDADDFHPPENVSKMRAGIALDDSDRLPWLERLHDEIESWLQQGEPAVLACSALKQAYRDMLGIDQKAVISVYLKGSYELIQERVNRRRHRYMPDNLLRSQFDTLEEPRGGITVDISLSPARIVDDIIARLEDLSH